MSKTCKNCWSKNENPLLKYCKKCIYENSFYNLKQTRINNVSKNNKNTPARFSKEVKAQILLRDKHCIFCWNSIQDYHHVYFSNEANRSSSRNNVNQWVWVCRICHDEIHSCKSWEWKRQEAINYLNNYYNNECY